MGLTLRDLVGTGLLDSPSLIGLEYVNLYADGVSDDEDYDSSYDCDDWDGRDEEVDCIGCTDYADPSECPGCADCMG